MKTSVPKHQDSTMVLVGLVKRLSIAAENRDIEELRELLTPFKLAIAEYKLLRNVSAVRNSEKYKYVLIRAQEFEDAIDNFLRSRSNAVRAALGPDHNLKEETC